MAAKTIGYIISIVGIIVLALSYPGVRTALKISNMGLTNGTITAISLAIIIVGLVFAFNPRASKNKQEDEVPIYEGEGKNRRIVGYKRMNKK